LPECPFRWERRAVLRGQPAHGGAAIGVGPSQVALRIPSIESH